MNFIVSPTIMLKIKHVYQRNNTAYWERRVPKDLADRYPSRGPLKINLRTLDPTVIAAKVERLNKQHEALWAAMRKDPSLTPVSAKEEARKLLKAHGVETNGRGTDEASLSVFLDRLDTKREAYAHTQEVPEEAYQNALLCDFLSEREVAAVRIIQGSNTVLVSDALEAYLDEHPKRGRPGFSDLEENTRRVVGRLIKLLGDKPLQEVSREEAKSFRDSLMGVMKTESVQRNINVVKAVFTRGIAEKSLNIPNVWNKLSVAGLGEDSESREPFAPEELKKLRELCRAKDDDVRWIVALQIDTGARLAEIAGLSLDDIHIKGEEIPYIDIRPKPWRTLKTKNSERIVPLVGESLWAAARVLERAEKGVPYAFPRYIRDGKCLATNASATINKWMEGAGLSHTTHELRHTMRDRLRNSGATRDIQDAVGGWGKSQIADTYGKGYALRMMQTAMQAAEA